MEKFKKVSLNILVLVFFIHGILYFLTPDTIYNSSNPFKLIKYVVFALTIVMLYVGVSYRKWISKVWIGIISVLVLVLIFSFANDLSNISLFVNYIFPFMMVLIINDILKYVDLKKMSIVIYTIATVMAYINSCFLKGIFSKWHVSGEYREVSIFINPNNFGIMICLFLILFLVFFKNEKNTKKTLGINIALIINSFLLIRMSGSNTALIVFGITIAYYLVKLFINIKVSNIKDISRKKAIICGVTAFLIFVVIILLFKFVFLNNINIRSISLESGSIRLNTYKEFIYSTLSNLIFPYRNNCVLVDNMYLTLWGNFGFLVLVVFLLYNIYLTKLTIKNKKIDYTFILVVFLMIGCTTNYLYLWPIGYIYWGLSLVVLNDNKSNIFKNINNKLADYNMKTIFSYGKQNDEYFRQEEKRKITFSFNFKYFIWIMIMILFSQRKKLNINKVYLIYGKMHEKIFRDADNNFKLHYGTSLKSVTDIKSNITIISLWTFSDRIAILITSIYSAIKNKINFRDIWFWVDFTFLRYFIEEGNFKELTICGHFDRYAVWISYLCKANNIRFSISQHGALSEISLPIKVPCDVCLAFNEMEKVFFQKFVISNDDCTYEIKGFNSDILFECIKKQKEYIYVGIASQPTYTNQTIEIVTYLHSKYKNKVKIYVYPHPREKVLELIEMQKQGKCKVYSDEKHVNLDILVTFFSTVVYDFLSKNQHVKIICLPPKEINMSFFYLKQVNLIERKEDIDEYINKGKIVNREVLNEKI